MGGSFLEYGDSGITSSVAASKIYDLTDLTAGVSEGYVTNAINGFVSYNDL